MTAETAGGGSAAPEVRRGGGASPTVLAPCLIEVRLAGNCIGPCGLAALAGVEADGARFCPQLQVLEVGGQRGASAAGSGARAVVAKQAGEAAAARITDALAKLSDPLPSHDEAPIEDATEPASAGVVEESMGLQEAAATDVAANNAAAPSAAPSPSHDDSPPPEDAEQATPEGGRRRRSVARPLTAPEEVDQATLEDPLMPEDVVQTTLEHLAMTSELSAGAGGDVSSIVGAVAPTPTNWASVEPSLRASLPIVPRTPLGQKVAVKRLKTDREGSDAASVAAELRHETRVLAALSHPCILTLIGYGLACTDRP